MRQKIGNALLNVGVIALMIAMFLHVMVHLILGLMDLTTWAIVVASVTATFGGVLTAEKKEENIKT